MLSRVSQGAEMEVHEGVLIYLNHLNPYLPHPITDDAKVSSKGKASSSSFSSSPAVVAAFTSFSLPWFGMEMMMVVVVVVVVLVVDNG